MSWMCVKLYMWTGVRGNETGVRARPMNGHDDDDDNENCDEPTENCTANGSKINKSPQCVSVEHTHCTISRVHHNRIEPLRPFFFETLVNILFIDTVYSVSYDDDDGGGVDTGVLKLTCWMVGAFTFPSYVWFWWTFFPHCKRTDTDKWNNIITTSAPMWNEKREKERKKNGNYL